MARTLRCRLGKHKWRRKGGQADPPTYFCQVCGKTLDKPPRQKWGASEGPHPPGAPYGGGGGVG
jgi:hypothetical protein